MPPIAHYNYNGGIFDWWALFDHTPNTVIGVPLWAINMDQWCPNRLDFLHHTRGRGINPWAIKLKKSKILITSSLPPAPHVAITARSCNLFRYNKEQLFKKKQGAVVQKTVIQKENKGQLFGKQFFKKREGTVARKTVFQNKHCQRHYGPRRWLLCPVILV